MSRTLRIVAGIVAVVVVLVVIALAYIWVSGGSGEPSTAISAPTLALPTRSATAEPTEAVTPELTAESEIFDATPEMAVEPAVEPADTAAEASDFVVFNIDPAQSQVSFTLTEDLNHQPTTVVGTTDQVAGQIAVSFSDPQASQVGEIRINARTLATDQEMRNRTIRSQILQSSQPQYEFISFQPTAITGLPDAITMNAPVTFQITGDLTIRDITQPVTFDVTATPLSLTLLEGTAETTVQRADFDLNIPNVPQVANVSEDVQLKIEFVATTGSAS